MKKKTLQFNKAHWIWCSTEEAPVNAVANFRARFQSEGASGSCKLLISAENRFLVYLNGKRVGYGPPRNYPEHYEFEVFEVGELLRKGNNVLAVTVLHWGEGTFQSLPGRAGLIAELMDEKGESLVATGSSWKGRLDPSYRRDTSRIACQLGFEEQVEAQPEDWLGNGYSDRAWVDASVVGNSRVKPWGKLKPSTIPPLTDEIWNCVSVKSAGRWKQPDLVIGLRTNEYLTPGNRMVNSDQVRGFFATRLLVEEPGRCTIRRCAMYGGPIRVFLDGRELEFTQDTFDLCAERDLKKGEHLFLVEWNGITHDKDTAFSFSGITGLKTAPLSSSAKARWLFHPSPKDPELLRNAKGARQLLRAAANWEQVSPQSAPEHDTYMNLSGSLPVPGDGHRKTALPITLAPLAGPGLAHRLEIDFSKHGLGFLDLEFEAAQGATVELLGCEGFSNGQLQLTELMSNCARYVCREGKQRFLSIVPRGLRYLILQICPGNRPFVLSRTQLRVATYPWKPEGFFRCSDPRINQIYELCCHTLRMSSMDVFIDATYEQALWVGDMASMTVPVHHYVQGDPRLPARCLRMVGQSLERFSLAQSQVPSAWTDRPIPNWSFFWVLGVRDHYFFTGNKALVRALLPALLKQAKTVIGALNAEGLFQFSSEAWHFLDWNGLEGDHTTTKPKVYANENLLALAALEATAFLAREVGSNSASTKLKRVCSSLRKAICRRLQNPKTGAFSEHRIGGKTIEGITASTQICALLAGLPPGKSAELKTILPPSDWVPTGTPWMWSLGALSALQANYGEEVLAGIRHHWGRMLDNGATTAWEMFEGGHRPGLPTRSWCHGWSSGPAWLLPAYILGARPATPGWGKAIIEPVPGDLEWAEGRIPTPHGPIHLAWEKSGAGLKIEANLPRGVVSATEE